MQSSILGLLGRGEQVEPRLVQLGELGKLSPVAERPAVSEPERVEYRPPRPSDAERVFEQFHKRLRRLEVRVDQHE